MIDGLSTIPTGLWDPLAQYDKCSEPSDEKFSSLMQASKVKPTLRIVLDPIWFLIP